VFVLKARTSRCHREDAVSRSAHRSNCIVDRGVAPTMPYKDKEKQRAFQREHSARRYQERRNQWLESKGGKCATCGSPHDLEVDHVDPTGKIDHSVWSWSDERRDKELSKCQPLCKSCHLKKTLEWSRLIDGNGNLFCGYCKQFKEPVNFIKKSSRWSGRDTECKTCKSTRNKKRDRKKKSVGS
jgi:5-methylcytosine-specific restriction endonuclease McrA